MRPPQAPPSFDKLFLSLKTPARMGEIYLKAQKYQPQKYLHWDKLRFIPPPEGLTHEEWWLALKLSRKTEQKAIPLQDTKGAPFTFTIPGQVQEELHQIDLGAGGAVSFPEPITNPHTRDRYIVKSLMEEAITSSQLEGAVTTREIAKELIRTNRKPRDTSEQMILNNYVTMQRIREYKDHILTPELIFQIHTLVTHETLEEPSGSGRFRRPNEERYVADDTGHIFHTPPPADTLAERMQLLCDFANGKIPDYFIHPAIRAIIIHFWIGYDHPFLDGNGRTARALFYWAMLHHKYWLFEFISISNILKKAPIDYYRSFLYTETDENDLTYFLVAQTKVIRRAIKALHEYIEHKTSEIREIDSHMRALNLFNHRQVEIIKHALKHPGQRYSFRSHQNSHNISYQTARTDLLDLCNRKLLDFRKHGKEIILISPSDLSSRLLHLEREELQ